MTLTDTNDQALSQMAKVAQDWRATAERWEADYRALQLKTEKLAEDRAKLIEGLKRASETVANGVEQQAIATLLREIGEAA
jgi:hypothetical protein